MNTAPCSCFAKLVIIPESTAWHTKTNHLQCAKQCDVRVDCFLACPTHCLDPKRIPGSKMVDNCVHYVMLDSEHSLKLLVRKTRDLTNPVSKNAFLSSMVVILNTSPLYWIWIRRDLSSCTLPSQLWYITFVNHLDDDITHNVLWEGNILGQKLEDNCECNQNLEENNHAQPQQIIVRGIYHDDNKDPRRANDGNAKLCCMAGIK